MKPSKQCCKFSKPNLAVIQSTGKFDWLALCSASVDGSFTLPASHSHLKGRIFLWNGRIFNRISEWKPRFLSFNIKGIPRQAWRVKGHEPGIIGSYSIYPYHREKHTSVCFQLMVRLNFNWKRERALQMKRNRGSTDSHLLTARQLYDGFYGYFSFRNECFLRKNGLKVPIKEWFLLIIFMRKWVLFT